MLSGDESIGTRGGIGKLARLKRALAKKLKLVKEERRIIEDWKARLETEISRINEKIDFGVYRELERLRAKDDELKDTLSKELKSHFLELSHELKSYVEELRKEKDYKLLAISSGNEALKSELELLKGQIAKLENNILQNLNSALNEERTALKNLKESVRELEDSKRATELRLEHFGAETAVLKKSVELKSKEFEKELKNLALELEKIELREGQKLFSKEPVYPFVAVVGQEKMKRALILNIVNPSIGGVLLWGLRGNGKFTAIRGVAEIAPKTDRCKFFYCESEDCQRCDRRYSYGTLPLVTSFGKSRGTYIIDWLSMASAITIDAAKSLQFSFSPRSLPSVLIKIPLRVEVKMVEDYELGIEIIKRREEFAEDPEKFRAKYENETKKLSDKILKARERLPNVFVSEDIYRTVAELTKASRMNDIAIVIEQLARAQAAYDGRDSVTVDDVVDSSDIILSKQ
ncbi:MAG: hypothetical protein QMD21_02800 [Candidatus Thermoplasmatota archaeon]|nr:hypothetical protein [Candidatus Thermoplasmatota archaeon]MDI6855697.1 hypothetical protein [Candidatus Thermoplasmatota archaeon]